MINTLSASKIFHPLSDKNQWSTSQISSLDQRTVCIALSVLILISTLGLAHLFYFISSALYNRSVKPIHEKQNLKIGGVDQIPLGQSVVRSDSSKVIGAQSSPSNFQNAKKVALYVGLFLTLMYASKTLLPNAVDYLKEEIIKNTKQMCLKKYDIYQAGDSFIFNFDRDMHHSRNYVHKVFKFISLTFHPDKSPWLDSKFYNAANKGKEIFDNYLVCLKEYGAFNIFGWELKLMPSEFAKSVCYGRYNLVDASRKLSVAFDMSTFEVHKMKYVNLIYKTVIDLTRHFNPNMLQNTTDKLGAAKEIFGKYINCTGL